MIKLQVWVHVWTTTIHLSLNNIPRYQWECFPFFLSLLMEHGLFKGNTYKDMLTNLTERKSTDICLSISLEINLSCQNNQQIVRIYWG